MPGSEAFLTQHMAAHIAAINMLAPLCVAAGLRFAVGRIALPGAPLVPATVLQLMLIWGWHLPAVFDTAVCTPALMAAMHASLFLSACWFWLAVMREARSARWTPLAALLVTGKLFCLLGVLLAFAPRALYGQDVPICFGATQSPALADQQLAGLLMLTACPVVYVGAAVAVACRWFAALAKDGGWNPVRRGARWPS